MKDNSNLIQETDQFFKNYNSGNEDRLLTKNEIAKFLQISISTINYMMLMSGLPYYKVGRSVRFNKDDVLAWITKPKEGKR